MSRLAIEITIEVDEGNRWQLHEALNGLGYTLAEGGEVNTFSDYTYHPDVEIEYTILDEEGRRDRDTLLT